MDVKLEELIEKIKKEGVEEARQQANQIIKEARAKERDILQKAKKEAERVREQGKKEVKNFQKSSEESLKQAARNLTLSLKEKLTDIFKGILKQELRKSLSSEFLADTLKKIIDKWDLSKDKSLEVLLSQEDKKALEEFLLKKFKESAKEKIEIRISSSVSKGFQIGIKGEDSYYDFSDESIVESLSLFLNSFLASLISDKKDG